MTLLDFKPEHEAEFYAMCRDFFSSPAVCHQIKEEDMKTTFDLAVKGSPYLRGLVMAKGENIWGYVLLSFTYSNEVGGMVVWIEELYVKEAYRNQGFGKQALDWIIKEYKETTKRFRLEVTEENKGAKKLYRSFGFDILPYQQMTLE